WESGVEEYSGLSLEDVKKALGLPDGQFPCFNSKEDPLGHDPWTPEGLEALKADTALPLNPRWHQYIGVLKMMRCAINGDPVLLMDKVGVGKTMQAVMFIALRVYYREYFTQHGKFPGMFGKFDQQAVKSDAAEIFDLQNPYRPVLKNHRRNVKDSTIYGHTFGAAFFDEIHAARTVSRLFVSFAEVRSSCQAGFMVGMTVTP
ncbi:hypothetical protein WOLCODRAFT_59536, partial [Wolfiporia cocos MD-104 SS10]